MKKQTAALILLLATSTLFCSCSVLVRSGGTYESEFFFKDATRDTIQHQLGKPILTQQYNTPIYLHEVPELQSDAKRLSRREWITVAYREDFQYRGWIRQVDDNDGPGMMFFMTAGLSEIFLFPWAIYHRIRDPLVLHTFQVWFAPNDRYVYHRKVNGSGARP